MIYFKKSLKQLKLFIVFFIMYKQNLTTDIQQYGGEIGGYQSEKKQPNQKYKDDKDNADDSTDDESLSTSQDSLSPKSKSSSQEDSKDKVNDSTEHESLTKSQDSLSPKSKSKVNNKQNMFQLLTKFVKRNPKTTFVGTVGSLALGAGGKQFLDNRQEKQSKDDWAKFESLDKKDLIKQATEEKKSELIPFSDKEVLASQLLKDLATGSSAAYNDNIKKHIDEALKSMDSQGGLIQHIQSVFQYQIDNSDLKKIWLEEMVKEEKDTDFVIKFCRKKIDNLVIPCVDFCKEKDQLNISKNQGSIFEYLKETYEKLKKTIEESIKKEKEDQGPKGGGSQPGQQQPPVNPQQTKVEEEDEEDVQQFNGQGGNYNQQQFPGQGGNHNQQDGGDDQEDGEQPEEEEEEQFHGQGGNHNQQPNGQGNNNKQNSGETSPQQEHQTDQKPPVSDESEDEEKADDDQSDKSTGPQSKETSNQQQEFQDVSKYDEEKVKKIQKFLRARKSNKIVGKISKMTKLILKIQNKDILVADRLKVKNDTSISEEERTTTIEIIDAKIAKIYYDETKEIEKKQDNWFEAEGKLNETKQELLPQINQKFDEIFKTLLEKQEDLIPEDLTQEKLKERNRQNKQIVQQIQDLKKQLNPSEEESKKLETEFFAKKKTLQLLLEKLDGEFIDLKNEINQKIDNLEQKEIKQLEIKAEENNTTILQYYEKFISMCEISIKRTQEISQGLKDSSYTLTKLANLSNTKLYSSINKISDLVLGKSQQQNEEIQNKSKQFSDLKTQLQNLETQNTQLINEKLKSLKRVQDFRQQLKLAVDDENINTIIELIMVRGLNTIEDIEDIINNNELEASTIKEKIDWKKDDKVEGGKIKNNIEEVVKKIQNLTENIVLNNVLDKIELKETKKLQNRKKILTDFFNLKNIYEFIFDWCKSLLEEKVDTEDAINAFSKKLIDKNDFTSFPASIREKFTAFTTTEERKNWKENFKKKIDSHIDKKINDCFAIKNKEEILTTINSIIGDLDRNVFYNQAVEDILKQKDTINSENQKIITQAAGEIDKSLSKITLEEQKKNLTERLKKDWDYEAIKNETSLSEKQDINQQLQKTILYIIELESKHIMNKMYRVFNKTGTFQRFSIFVIDINDDCIQIEYSGKINEFKIKQLKSHKNFIKREKTIDTKDTVDTQMFTLLFKELQKFNNLDLDKLDWNSYLSNTEKSKKDIEDFSTSLKDLTKKLQDDLEIVRGEPILGLKKIYSDWEGKMNKDETLKTNPFIKALIARNKLIADQTQALYE